MSRSARALHRAEAGSALIEFIVLGVAVIVPIAYTVLAVATVQAASFASSQAVREAGRAFASAATPRDAVHRATVAARLALADQGYALPSGALHLTCAEGACLAPGSVVEVRLAWDVAVSGLTVPVEAAQVVPIDDFRGDP